MVVYLIVTVLLVCIVTSSSWKCVNLKVRRSNSRLQLIEHNLKNFDEAVLSFISKTNQLNTFNKSSNSNLSNLDRIVLVSKTVEIWKETLYHGYLPESSPPSVDSVDRNINTNCNQWPDETLSHELYSVMHKLNIPILTRRHPELIPSVIRSLLELIAEYSNQIQSRKNDQGKVKDGNNDDEEKYMIDYYINQNTENDKEKNLIDHIPLTEEELILQEVYKNEELAKSLVKQFEKKWTPPLTGLESLDELYGSDHGLLSFTMDNDEDKSVVMNDNGSDSSSESDGNTDDGNGAKGGAGNGKYGYGLFSGVWKHTGWNQLKFISDNLKNMKELKDLMRSLGKRPSVNGNELRKYPPQLEANVNTAPLGVAKSQLAPVESSGLRHSDTLEGLLPSETMLLSGQLKNEALLKMLNNLAVDDENEEENDDLLSIVSQKTRNKGKLLFLAKRIEKLLSSYDKTGWFDMYSLPRRKPWRHMKKLPTTTGGPIIVCLDTSWSMVGPRENLAKSVVLEASIMASKQNRACYVIAFSGAADIAQCSLPIGIANKHNLIRLLDFLGSSFRGGTDVTSALTCGLDLMQTHPDWSGADIILVTDGELQNPPVSQQVFAEIDMMEKQYGLLIHGLLIGKSQSIPLSMLCSDYDDEHRIYDFLYKYDPLMMLQRKQQQQQQDQNSNENSVHGSSDMSYDSINTSPNGRGSMTISNKSIPKSSTKSSRQIRDSSSKTITTKLYMTSPNSQDTTDNNNNRHHNSIHHQLQSVAIDTTVNEKIQSTSQQLFHDIYSLLLHKNNNINIPHIQQSILASITLLNQGLVERESEVRLLLLAVLCREHIILLGPPGTGKSELGRRLASVTRTTVPTDALSQSSSSSSSSMNAETSDKSNNNNNIFFERLLTKYTNPEELFGPLSLLALERDEYIRNTNGYLPTARIAFLDEIFKANSAILNSLLTILNERQFDNGNKRANVPLLAVVAASNELPESEELDALYDRFLLRKQVNSVSDTSIYQLLQPSVISIRSSYINSISKSSNNLDSNNNKNDDDMAIDSATKVRRDDNYPPVHDKSGLITQELIDGIQQTIQSSSSSSSEASMITLSKDVLNLFRDIRVYLRDECDPSVYVSDRRLVKAANMLKVIAVVHGRNSVSILDCLLLQHVLWFSPDEQPRVYEWILKKITPTLQNAGIPGIVFLIESVVQKLIGVFQGSEDWQYQQVLDDRDTILNNKNSDSSRSSSSSSVTSSSSSSSSIDKQLLASLVYELDTISSIVLSKIASYQILLLEVQGVPNPSIINDDSYNSSISSSCSTSSSNSINSSTNSSSNIHPSPIFYLNRNFKTQSSSSSSSSLSSSTTSHIFLSPVEMITVRQQLVPKIEYVVQELYRLLLAIYTVRQTAQFQSSSSSSSTSTKNIIVDGMSSSVSDLLERVWQDYISNNSNNNNNINNPYASNSFSRSNGENNNNDHGDDDGIQLTSFELGLSKKKAQKMLSPEQFKIWKKAQKSNKKGSSTSSSDDNNSEDIDYE